MLTLVMRTCEHAFREMWKLKMFEKMSFKIIIFDIFDVNLYPLLMFCAYKLLPYAINLML